MRNQLREALIGRAIESNLVAERAPRAGSSSDGNGDHASVDERAMPPPSSSLRLLGDELIEPEPAWKRTFYIVVAAVVLACFVYATHSFWAPAHPGVDHNGYLVGGKMLAQRFSPGMKPNEPYAFVGWMWVRTPDGWYYPKYPVGLPLLNAAALWLDPAPGDPHGKVWALLVAPICTTLGLAATFLLVRLVAGSFLGVMGMILLATSMTTLAITNSPWSHGPALCFVTWGMYLLVRWWQTGSIWRGAAAGLLLGYAVTIRYTEGLLVLPIALVVLSMARWRRPRTYLRALTPALAWLVPVLALVTFNKLSMGTWTGYDSTNESTGFTWKNFSEKWEFMAQQVYDYGLFFVAPLAVLGLALMYRASWRVALLLTLWFVPGVLIYTAYYWGLQRGGPGGVGYLRFFFTLFPAAIVAACWLMSRASDAYCYLAPGHDRGPIGNANASVAAPIACGCVVAVAAAIGVKNALPALVREHVTGINLAYTTDQIVRAVPRGSVVFVQQTGGGPVNQMMNFLQFKGDYDLYAADAFARAGMGMRGGMRMGAPTEDQPNPLQPARQKFLADVVYKDKSDADLVNEQNRVMGEALARGQRVYLLTAGEGRRNFESRYLKNRPFVAAPVTHWKELATIPADANTTPLQPQARGGGPGGPPVPGPGRERGAPQAWQVIEITRAPATQPSTQPSTQLTTPTPTPTTRPAR